MALTSGTRLGPYEIVSPLGAGGMGEVYRAKDTRLDRTVAVKVLPSHLSADPELKQRMEREAKAISALQHAHICTLFDIGSQDGTNFLVMEYLEGQTLAERLARGALPIDQVLKIGSEIAHALEKAHQQGIIHRDLKPANIMLTKAGAKLMDFGLAKPELAIAPQAVGPFTPSTPTMNLASLTAAVSPLTQKGSIVGTFQYMAPELLQGAEADARSDLFSFGCVLYEMITGRRAFEGKSQLSVFTSILEKDPEPVTTIQPLAPPLLDRVVRACLEKDPADRFQSAHDVAMDLCWISDSTQIAPENAPSRLNKAWTAGFALLALAFVALAGFAGYRWALSSEATVSLHAEIPPPDKFSLDATGDAGGMPVLSPQGDKVAFVAHSGETKLLWVRSLNSDSAQALEGTAGAAHPFWSPDGGSIGFFAGGKVMRIAATGGPIANFADAPNSRGGSWSASGIIVFAPDNQTFASFRFFRCTLLTAVILAIIAPALSPAQELARRLILKDGSFQMVTKYEVKGDRVRYKSAERDEWEELPSDLVDWPATEKYEKDRATSAIPEAKALDKETDAERAAEESHLPQVAPGLRLPEDSGVFLLDNFQGEPQIVELQQLEGDINNNTRGNILRGAIKPASAKQTVELDGEHATIHSHVAVPSIYINVDEQDRQNTEPPEGETDSAKPSLPSLDAPRAKSEGPQQPQQPEAAIIPFDRFRIVRAKVKNGKRTVTDIKRNVTGKVSQNQDFVKTTITRVSGGWLKLTPTEDLPPGEYVLVEMKGTEGMNLYVWDFGVDAKAPANPNPWKPAPKSDHPAK